jgi:hypothetical protein
MEPNIWKDNALVDVLLFVFLYLDDAIDIVRLKNTSCIFLQTFILYKRDILEHLVKIVRSSLIEASQRIDTLHSSSFNLKGLKKCSRIFSDLEMQDLIQTQEGIKHLKSHVNSSVRCHSVMIWLLQQLDEIMYESQKVGKHQSL